MIPVQKTEQTLPHTTAAAIKPLQKVLDTVLPAPIRTAAAIVAETVEIVNDLSSQKKEDQENGHERREDVRQKPPHINYDRLKFFSELGTRIYGLGIAKILKPLIEKTFEVGTQRALESSQISDAAKKSITHTLNNVPPKVLGETYTREIVEQLKSKLTGTVARKYTKLQPGVLDTLLHVFDLIAEHGSFNEKAVRDLARKNTAFKIIMNSLPGSGMNQIIALAAEVVDPAMEESKALLEKEDKLSQQLAQKALKISDLAIVCEGALRTVAQAVTKYSMWGIRLIAIASR